MVPTQRASVRMRKGDTPPSVPALHIISLLSHPPSRFQSKPHLDRREGFGGRALTGSHAEQGICYSSYCPVEIEHSPVGTRKLRVNPSSGVGVLIDV